MGRDEHSCYDSQVKLLRLDLDRRPADPSRTAPSHPSLQPATSPQVNQPTGLDKGPVAKFVVLHPMRYAENYLT